MKVLLAVIARKVDWTVDLDEPVSSFPLWKPLQVRAQLCVVVGFSCSWLLLQLLICQSASGQDWTVRHLGCASHPAWRQLGCVDCSAVLHPILRKLAHLGGCLHSIACFILLCPDLWRGSPWIVCAFPDVQRMPMKITPYKA